MTDRSYIPVFSFDYAHLARSDQWYYESEGFVDCSVDLLGRLVAGDLPRKWPHVKAAAFLFAHALELFFKAGIIQAGQHLQRGHNLPQLLGTFRKLYPGNQFHFECAVDDVTGHDPAKPFFEFLKYPESGAGAAWKGDVHIEIVEWRRQVTLFAADIRRMWPLMKQRYPGAPT
jgi:hypothetical protein